jgi:thioredoxin reductase (NADPH)
MQPGGQMTITTDVENFPGFPEIIQGPWLMEQIQAQAEGVGTNMISDLIIEANLQKKPFKLTGDSGNTYTCNALIISTGAEAKWLGLDSELKYQGFGVSACATCDGFFYRGKQVAVVGGGNTAVEEAIYLTKHATKVMLIHRRNSLRAEKMLQKRLLANPKIEIIWDSALEEVMGKHEGPMPEVTGIRVRNIKTDNITEYSLEGVFIAIGHQPNTSIFVNQLKMDEEGYLITQPDSTATNIPGIFAAGDVQDNKFRQAVTAAGTGCMAALETEKYLASIVNQTTVAAQ